MQSSFGKNSVENNLHQHMCNLHGELDDFYSIEEHFESGDHERYLSHKRRLRFDSSHHQDPQNTIAIMITALTYKKVLWNRIFVI